MHQPEAGPEVEERPPIVDTALQQVRQSWSDLDSGKHYTVEAQPRRHLFAQKTRYYLIIKFNSVDVANLLVSPRVFGCETLTVTAGH